MIIWLASYPKSGNTLLRSILISLIYSEDGKVDFNQLLKIENFPTPRYFENFLNKFDDLKQLSNFWIKAQEEVNKNKKLKIFKTHNANCKLGENIFTNKENTIATIYIVRDPRDVLISSSKYYETSYDETSKIMNNMNTTITNVVNENNLNKDIKTYVGSWAFHYNSWTKKNPNLLLIKYEDLIKNKENEIHRIIKFINKFKTITVSDDKILKCVETSSFENMKIMEDQGLFNEQSENSKGQKITFFNNGKSGSWKGILNEKIVKEVEQNFFKEMKELGYL